MCNSREAKQRPCKDLHAFCAQHRKAVWSFFQTYSPNVPARSSLLHIPTTQRYLSIISIIDAGSKEDLLQGLTVHFHEASPFCSIDTHLGPFLFWHLWLLCLLSFIILLVPAPATYTPDSDTILTLMHNLNQFKHRAWY